MRYKEPFIIYPRKLKSITVFYYQCYDKSGKRICGHSTGQRTKTAAWQHCMDLLRKGKLVPEHKPLKFAEFAAGWWDPKTCKYLQWRQMQNPLAPSTIDHYKTGLENHIKPHFGKMKLHSITTEVIKDWVLSMAHKGYKNASINIFIAIIKVMFKEAVRLKLIPFSPADQVKKLSYQSKEVNILNTEEMQRLFPVNWNDVWESYDIYIFNKLAACTGMRPGEIMGLQGEHVFSDHIHVCVQFSHKYGLIPLKTKDSRDIPITECLYHELRSLSAKNNDGFLFSGTGGNQPITRNRLYKETGMAFDRIGINLKERKKRRLILHHWRHFLNTALLMANINTLKVQKVTGHKSLSMTKYYAHFDSREFREVRDVQNSLLSR